MKLYRQNIAALIFAIALLALVLGVFLTSSSWDEERILKWIGALSGWAAALAAGTTVMVLLHQTKKNEEVAHRENSDALELFSIKIEPHLQRANWLWKLAEDIANPKNLDDNTKEYCSNLYVEIRRLGERVSNDEVLREPLGHMFPLDRRKCTNLIERLISLQDASSYPKKRKPANKAVPKLKHAPTVAQVRRAKVLLSGVCRAASLTNPEFSKIFKNRNQSIDVIRLELSREDQERLRAYLEKRDFPSDIDNPL
ncbi:hypothetical protein [uncultured Roseibium sp.]|uniref:hypothetical protein n=1 Tax=uncultured Roseibium sp. TaxID=1936171 RepID=UPI00262E6916|nr:hypothetical protein [uncultured Roseibium sp.]